MMLVIVRTALAVRIFHVALPANNLAACLVVRILGQVPSQVISPSLSKQNHDPLSDQSYDTYYLPILYRKVEETLTAQLGTSWVHVADARRPRNAYHFRRELYYPHHSAMYVWLCLEAWSSVGLEKASRKSRETLRFVSRKTKIIVILDLEMLTLLQLQNFLPAPPFANTSILQSQLLSKQLGNVRVFECQTV